MEEMVPGHYEETSPESKETGGLPGGPMAKTPQSQCR